MWPATVAELQPEKGTPTMSKPETKAVKTQIGIATQSLMKSKHLKSWLPMTSYLTMT